MRLVACKQNGEEEEEVAAAAAVWGRSSGSEQKKKQRRVALFLCQSVCRGQLSKVVIKVRMGMCTGLMHGYSGLSLPVAAVERTRAPKRCEHEFMESRQSVLPQQEEYRMSRSDLPNSCKMKCDKW